MTCDSHSLLVAPQTVPFSACGRLAPVQSAAARPAAAAAAADKDADDLLANILDDLGPPGKTSAAPRPLAAAAGRPGSSSFARTMAAGPAAPAPMKTFSRGGMGRTAAAGAGNSSRIPPPTATTAAAAARKGGISAAVAPARKHQEPQESFSFANFNAADEEHGDVLEQPAAAAADVEEQQQEFSFAMPGKTDHATKGN